MDRDRNAVNGGGNNINRDRNTINRGIIAANGWGNTVTSGEDIHKRKRNSCEKKVKYWEWMKKSFEMI